MSLGGFSTRDASVSGWNSVEIEVVLVVFMLLAVLNFTSHFLAWRERSVGAYWRDPEARWVWALILGSGVALAGFLMWSGTYADPLVALRHAVFNTVSIATTTGYMSTDFDQWPLFAGLWMLLLCGIASSSGSTGGGIKMVRTLILFKEALRDMLRMSHPRAVQPLLLGGQIVPAPVIQAVLGFMLLYGATLGGLTLLLVATGMDLTTAVTAVVACLNNTGPGLARVGPSQNYQWMNDFQTWVCSFAMLAGRLELMTVFVLLTPAFWKR
jgi:trk system potassium uptake protein TrkH